MSEQNETVADILREMRIFRCRNLESGELELCTSTAHYFGDRIEAAHKREVADALDTGAFVEAAHKCEKATTEKFSSVGNIAELREANNETMADIVAEMREYIGFPVPFAPMNAVWIDDFKAVADRIEAAHKREVVVSKTETTTQGNTAKMREALEAYIALWDRGTMNDLDELKRVIGKMRDALSAPPRNCDRFRSWDEAAAEYERLVEEGKVEDGTWCEWLFSVGQYAPEGGAK